LIGLVAASFTQDFLGHVDSWPWPLNQWPY